MQRFCSSRPWYSRFCIYDTYVRSHACCWLFTARLFHVVGNDISMRNVSSLLHVLSFILMVCLLCKVYVTGLGILMTMMITPNTRVVFWSYPQVRFPIQPVICLLVLRSRLSSIETWTIIEHTMCWTWHSAEYGERGSTRNTVLCLIWDICNISVREW